MTRLSKNRKFLTVLIAEANRSIRSACGRYFSAAVEPLLLKTCRRDKLQTCANPTVLFAVTRLRHVSMNNIFVMPNHQSSITLIHRRLS